MTPDDHTVRSATQPTVCKCGKPAHAGTVWIQPGEPYTDDPRHGRGATRHATFTIIDEVDPDTLTAMLDNPTFRAAVDHALAAEAHRIWHATVPRHIGPRAQSARTFDPDAPSPWQRGTDPEIHDGRDRRRRGRRPNPFIHTTNEGMAPRRGAFGRRPRARARVRRIAQWVGYRLRRMLGLSRTGDWRIGRF
ncbi:hypothetical protein SEA_VALENTINIPUFF_32 [Microbacterium phage ValentiniPuff]|uniref:Uncharacterized protein n=1 Tax=Microbacterium phage ValentiniPuff TaxID=2315705 RepID=A0A386KQQ3_9CAUD|nr:hypothetical protein SEA_VALENTINIPUFF_32 [Microbacterium phage ValentiniPuff]